MVGTYSKLNQYCPLFRLTYAVQLTRLSLSRSPRNSPKSFEISVPRHIRFVEIRKKIGTTTFHKRICNLTPEVRDILKILWKRGEIFCYL